MKIWVIGRSYPLNKNNMQGSFELEQAKMLSRHGHKVAYLSCIFHPFKKIKRWGLLNWEEDNIKIYTNSVFYFPERVKLNFKYFKAYFWERLLSSVEEEFGVPDIIHVHYPTNITIFKTIVAYKSKGSKIVCTEHWSKVLLKDLKKYERKQLIEYVDNADTFITVSETLKSSILNIVKKNCEIKVVPNMINPVFNNKSDKMISKKFKFIAIGNQVNIKQFDKIIEAFKKFSSKNPNSELVLVGNGPEHSNLKKLSKQLNIFNKIVFTGSLSRKETSEELMKANVLINYSLYETFGVPIIESWALGKPVISSESVGVISNWDKRLGIQVSPKNLDSLEKAMDQTFIEYSKFDKEFIKDFALKHYSEESVYKKLIDIYK
ncbi:glycosyltransferase [Facklamia sp. P12955]|uniref:glycosyltransferase n=1 Tax=Facklamia sp. P12955 TaxID=3421946 RepID=UPI003D16DFB8